MTELADQFPIGELKFYPGAKSRDGKTARVFTYIDSRAVMARLDAVVGVDGWQDTYRVVDAATKAVECTLTVRLNDKWVSKTDVGYPNDAKDADNAAAEPFKAAYSDALKRAAVHYGIGRYIYDLELARDYVAIDEWGKFTEQPRLKGDAAPMPIRPPIQNTPAPEKKGFFAVMEELGFSRDSVTAESQRMFNNKEPRQLTKEEMKSLQLSLEEKAKRELVHA